jgi:hypothetical protein
LTPAGQGRDDGTFVSQSAIFNDHGIYYMYYSYRGTEVLSGIRYATSIDGKIWVKQEERAICLAASDTPDGSWTEYPKNPIFRPSGIDGTFDKAFVATPAFNLLNN